MFFRIDSRDAAGRSIEVIVHEKRGFLEMFSPQINVLFLRLKRYLWNLYAIACEVMALAPCPQGAHLDKLNGWMPIVPLSRFGEKRAKPVQKYRVFPVR